METGTAAFLRKFGTHIKTICEKYRINKLYLFGSSTENIDMADDYDLAVEGAPAGKDYFKFDSALDRELDKESDLLDIVELREIEHPLLDIILKEGDIIYEEE